jgi:hypothetical protein
METGTNSETRQTQGTVVTMPARQSPPRPHERPPTPPGQTCSDTPDEPGYGHGV